MTLLVRISIKSILKSVVRIYYECCLSTTFRKIPCVVVALSFFFFFTLSITILKLEENIGGIKFVSKTVREFIIYKSCLLLLQIVICAQNITLKLI